MFLRDKKDKNTPNKFKFIGVIILFVANLVGLFLIFFNPKKWNIFIKKQKKEIEELSTGRESLSRFLNDSNKLFKSLFIPNEGNNHKPKALRPKSLLAYALIVVAVKVFVTGFLFFSYPDFAQLSAIVSSKMVSLTNEARAAEGLEPLEVNYALIEAATVKGQDMFNNQYFAHNTPDGKKPWELINRQKFDYVYAGENLAMDFVTAEVVQDAFMKSPTHRRNILNPKYKEIGIVVLEGKMNDRNTILLVEFFGTQRKDVTSSVAVKKPASGQATVPTTTKETPKQVSQNTPAIAQNKPAVAGESTPTEEITPVEEVSSPELLPAPSETTLVVSESAQAGKTIIDFVIEYSNIFFISFLIFIFISLMLNIFIKIRIQSSSVIVQTIVVGALITAMVLVKFHFVEQVPQQLLIL